MKVTVKLPRVADTVDEVVIVEWDVSVGATVAVGDTLVRVETDKAVVEVPSPVAGVVSELLVTADDDVTTGQPIAVIQA
ncbi:biotin/lipoyl-containing protein [Phytohabitans kaempferiae]|uniref:Biotin/lipoyl-containing protein n=1 Tax=Phytohabitans kaempferiae TaxID=1620943 RepID=A0ABV6M449_9ACTN